MQLAHPVHVMRLVKCRRTLMLCAPYCDICRAGIAYSVICKVFTPSNFHITYNRWDQFMFKVNNEIMVKQSNLIFDMHKQSCDTNWQFSFVVYWMNVTSSGPKTAAISSKALILDRAKPCRNMRWMFEILRFAKLDRCWEYVLLSLQYT